MTKKTNNLKIKILPTITKGRQEDFYLGEAKAAQKELKKYFNNEPKSITITICKNKKSFLQAIRKKNVPEWHIAHIPANSQSHIYIYDDLSSPIESKKLEQVITHEMTHLYINQVNKKLPDWLKEGLAVYFAEQIFKTNIDATNWRKITKHGSPFKKIKWDQAVKYDGYNISGLLILAFIQKFGWKSFSEALKKTNGDFQELIEYLKDKPKQFTDEFEKNYIKI